MSVSDVVGWTDGTLTRGNLRLEGWVQFGSLLTLNSKVLSDTRYDGSNL